jgi:hypothetical protein
MAHFVFVRSLGFGSMIIWIAVIKKFFILNVVIVALIWRQRINCLNFVLRLLPMLRHHRLSFIFAELGLPLLDFFRSIRHVMCWWLIVGGLDTGWTHGSVGPRRSYGRVSSRIVIHNVADRGMHINGFGLVFSFTFIDYEDFATWLLRDHQWSYIVDSIPWRIAIDSCPKIVLVLLSLLFGWCWEHFYGTASVWSLCQLFHECCIYFEWGSGWHYLLLLRRGDVVISVDKFAGHCSHTSRRSLLILFQASVR